MRNKFRELKVKKIPKTYYKVKRITMIDSDVLKPKVILVNRGTFASNGWIMACECHIKVINDPLRFRLGPVKEYTYIASVTWRKPRFCNMKDEYMVTNRWFINMFWMNSREI